MASNAIATRDVRTVSPVPRPQRPRPLLRRWRVLIPGLAVVVAMGYLGYVAFSAAAMYYLNVDELLARGPSAYGQNVRVSGMVLPGSIEKDPSANVLRFTVADRDSLSGTSMPVVYTGVVPDAFKADGNVVLEGKLAEDGTFTADNLLVKCPSKYRARTNGTPADDEHRPEHHSKTGSD